MGFSLGVLGSARVASGGGAWSPLDLGALSAWWDASDTASITASAGRVSQWNDKSGNGYHATQGTGSRQPLTGSNTINSLNALYFDAARFMASGLGASEPETTIAAVVTVAASGGNRTVTSASASGGIQTLVNVIAGSNTANQRTARVGVEFIVAAGTNTYTAPATKLLLWTFSDSGNAATQRMNGAANGSVSYNSSLTAGRTTLIGAQYVPGDFFFGDIGEIVICSSVLSGTDLTDLENYLMTKWGI